jgi:hypothetical protein
MACVILWRVDAFPDPLPHVRASWLMTLSALTGSLSRRVRCCGPAMHRLRCLHPRRVARLAGCRCSGYRGIPVHLLLGPIIGPSLAQERINNPRYGEDPHEEAPREENDSGNC